MAVRFTVDKNGRVMNDTYETQQPMLLGLTPSLFANHSFPPSARVTTTGVMASAIVSPDLPALSYRYSSCNLSSTDAPGHNSSYGKSRSGVSDVFFIS